MFLWTNSIFNVKINNEKGETVLQAKKEDKETRTENRIIDGGKIMAKQTYTLNDMFVLYVISWFERSIVKSLLIELKFKK